MGVYLNNATAYSLYEKETKKPYFVDKTQILEQLFPLVWEENSYICITRPRRFGKTVMANMISAFFSRGCDGRTAEYKAGELFDDLYIAKNENYHKFLNQYDVIHISFNEMPRKYGTYEEYIERIEKRLTDDLLKKYPELEIRPGEAVWDILTDIWEKDAAAKYIFVLDEWDFIFHRDFVADREKKAYISFLGNLLKDKPYVVMVYMTGILPIAKYSSGSELNMFTEFTMANSPAFSDYFGFREDEVAQLYERYLKSCEKPSVTRQGLKLWYNGYHTAGGQRVYNPRSVVEALRYNHLASYWTSAGPYDEIYYYIEKNVAEVRDDLALMAAGESVPARIQEYAATSMNLQTKDEIFSAMVVYGFLSCEKNRVSIPNKEIMDRFSDMLRKENSLGYVNRLARESDRMLKATLAGDTETMLEILEYTHDTEVPLLSYNNETELTAVVNLVYLSARDFYRVEREDKSGIGYVDFIFYPEVDKTADCIILELKVNASPEAAVKQIRDKKYDMRFYGRLGEKSEYTGRILAVGISYDKSSKKHNCKIKTIRERI